MNIILTSSFATVAEELASKNLVPKNPCRVAFITTAGNPYPETPWIAKDRAGLERLGYTIKDIDISRMSSEEVAKSLEENEVVFVAGGNTSYLAKAAKDSGFASVVTAALNRRALFIGSSAGSILAGPSVEPFLKEDNEEIHANITIEETQCLNLVPYVILPHYPGYAEHNDATEMRYHDRFPFVKLADNEYRIA